jgi:RNA polymerase sigma-70 factor (ECF subfamily)
MGEASFDWSTCLRQVRQQDPEAACRLVEQLYPHVLRIIATKLPRRESAEDLAQEIFLKMFTNLEQYRGEVPFEHWVSRIAVNHCLNALRAQRSRPEWRWADLSSEQADALDAALTTASDTPDPARAMAAKELVDKLLDTLEPVDRWLIRLLELEERSLEEVRQLTGWSSTRIRVRAFRARRRLNKNFQRLTNQKKL